MQLRLNWFAEQKFRECLNLAFEWDYTVSQEVNYGKFQAANSSTIESLQEIIFPAIDDQRSHNRAAGLWCSYALLYTYAAIPFIAFAAVTWKHSFHVSLGHWRLSLSITTEEDFPIESKTCARIDRYNYVTSWLLERLQVTLAMFEISWRMGASCKDPKQPCSFNNSRVSRNWSQGQRPGFSISSKA